MWALLWQTDDPASGYQQPQPAYVARGAGAFANNGSGVRGDLKAVFAAVLLDDEARNPATAAQPGLASCVNHPALCAMGRTFGIQSARGSWKIGDASNPATQLGRVRCAHRRCSISFDQAMFRRLPH